MTEPARTRRPRRRPSEAHPEGPRPGTAVVEPLPPLPTDVPVVGGLRLGSAEAGPEELARPLSLPGVSLEAAFYVVVTLVALGLRLWRLDDMPLSPAEAASALASLGLTPGVGGPGEAGALLELGNALLFAVLGATDTTARLLPALLGGLLPLTLAWGRRLIGRGPAAIAAALLALSPLQIDQSRAVSPGAIASTVTLALALAVFGYAARRRPGQLFWAAVLLALALAAGTPAFAALAALALLGITQMRRTSHRRRLPRDLSAALDALAPANGHAPAAALPTAERSHLDQPVGIAAPEAGPVPEPMLVESEPAMSGRQQVLRAAAIFAITLGVVLTGALTRPIGVAQGLFAPLGAFLDALAIGGAAGPLWRGPLTLLVYEPFALVFGALGAVEAWRRGRPFERFLVLWLLLGLLAAFASPERSAMLLASAVVPATLLAALVVHRLVVAVWQDGWSRYGVGLGVLVWGASLVLLGFGHVSLPDPIGVRYVGAALAPLFGQPGAAELATRLILLLPVVLFLGAIAYLWRRFGPAGRPALALAGATVLWLGELHAGWNLAYQAVDNVAELPRMEQTSVDVRALRGDVDAVLQVLTINRKERSIAIDEALRYPLAWYVRGGTVTFEPKPGGTPALLIVPADVKAPSGRYAGQRYRVSSTVEPGFENAAQLWRWLIYRESPRATVGRDVMLYVRAQ
ncbi:MAG TPA: glycosyltransferase family 39 protein [Chloroflexota bacterium]